MSRQLEGKSAIVTGAGRGIGEGIARVLAARGARVAVSDVSAEAAAMVANEIVESGGEAMSSHADVTSSASMQAFVESAISHFGQIDICVANAGVIGASDFQDRKDYTDDDWQLTYDVNVRGLVKTADAVVPHMRERRSGKIVNIASHAGRAPRGIAEPGQGNVQAPYSVSKAAAIQWTHLLAIELGAFNINVNVVCPGRLWTPMWEKLALNRKTLNPEVGHLSVREIFDLAITTTMPLGKEQTPDGIGKVVAFLVSDDAEQITGQALNVNGGAIMS
jgi:NAD(P)-dependent dehydrogenase (short-subunit alcohol dehydrogenase family)